MKPLTLALSLLLASCAGGVHTALGACCGNSDSDHSDGTKYGDTWTTETDDFLYDTTLKLQYYLRQEGDFLPNEDGSCFDGSDRLK